MVRLTGLLAILLMAASAALAADGTAWPPNPQLRARMLELQAAIQDPKTSPQDRKAARAELIKLLRSPDAAPVDPDNPRPARAAVPPVPASGPVRTNPPSDLPAPPVATVTPLPRSPETIVDPVTGKVLVPTGRAGVDPATGKVLPQVPGGYLDPRTGRIVPRP